jgi:hypothetical protein
LENFIINNEIDYKNIKKVAYILGLIIIISFIIYVKFFSFILRGFNLNFIFIMDTSIDTIITLFLIIITVYTLRIKDKRHTLLLLGFLVFIQAIFPCFGGIFLSSPKRFYPKIKVIDYLAKQTQPFRVFPIGGSDYEVYPPNIDTFYNIEGIENYDGMGVKWYDKLLFSSSLSFLNLTNTKYVINVDGFDLSKYGFKAIPTFNDVLWENPYAYNRAFMVYNYQTADTEQDAFELVRQYASRLSETAVVLSRDIYYLDFSTDRKDFETEKRSYNVVFERYTPNSIKMRVTTNSSGLLVISNTYFPGWHATVDGKEEMVIRADYAFQGIPIKHGTHTVIIRYLPFSFLLGGIISLISSVIVLLFFVYTKKRDANLS